MNESTEADKSTAPEALPLAWYIRQYLQEIEKELDEAPAWPYPTPSTGTPNSRRPAIASPSSNQKSGSEDASDNIPRNLAHEFENFEEYYVPGTHEDNNIPTVVDSRVREPFYYSSRSLPTHFH